MTNKKTNTKNVRQSVLEVSKKVGLDEKEKKLRKLLEKEHMKFLLLTMR